MLDGADLGGDMLEHGVIELNPHGPTPINPPTYSRRQVPRSRGILGREPTLNLRLTWPSPGVIC
jgi:hypothetical protein